jgi:Tol biopolymer transport system component/DNA-binding winged helix-turn-helix (wHTH) protein
MIGAGPKLGHLLGANMKLSTPLPHSVRFGNFELDTRGGELRAGNGRIRLQDQPLQILLILLEHPGELVTREALHIALWPENSFGDVEDSLNHAVRRLRDALGDLAEHPQFIETLPRRGYRFIAPVKPVPIGEPSMPPRGVHPVAHKALGALAGAALVAIAVAAYFLTRPLPLPRIVRSTKLTSDRLPKGDAIASDGIRLFFTELVRGHWSLVSIPIKGGEIVPVPTPFKDVSLLSGSPDGSELLLAECRMWDVGPLWVMPSGGGAPRRLGDAVGFHGSWSPDGKKIAWGNGPDVYVMNSNGTGSRKLVNTGGGKERQALHVAWSPDGKRLRFEYGSGGGVGIEIWEASPGGTGLHPLLPGWEEAPKQGFFSWTHDGKYFIFVSRKATSSDQLWAIRENAGVFRKTAEPVPLTTGPLDYWSSLPSRGGKKIFVKGHDQRVELTRFDMRMQEFVPYLGGISVSNFSFSKDGQWIAYVKVPERGLWRSRVSGGEQLSLTPGLVDVGWPRWSPDGKRIAFVGVTSKGTLGQASKVYLVPADGAAPPVEALSKTPCYVPSWSPDGNSLVFWCAEPSSRPGIYVLDLRTRQLSYIPESAELYLPSFTPDGRSVVAIDDHQISLFDLGQQKWRKLVAIEHPRSPNWSRDGRYIYFVTEGSEEFIYRLRITGRKLEKLASLENVSGIHASQWFSLAPDDSPLVVRDMGTNEIYALDWETP